MKKYCEKCNEEFKSDYKYCPYCGNKLEEKDDTPYWIKNYNIILMRVVLITVQIQLKKMHQSEYVFIVKI